MQFNLGVIYYDGKYKSRNINKVIHYFKFAADQNFPDAQYNLGFIYYEGRHILPDLNKTIHYLTIENPIIGRKPLNSDVTQKDGTFDLNEWLQPGKMLTNGPSFYKIPSIGDVPHSLNISLLEKKVQPAGILGSKPCNESTVNLALPVLFAILDAIKASNGDNNYEFPSLHFPMCAPRIKQLVGQNKI